VLTGVDLGADDGWPLERRPFPLEPSVPGVLAVGDVRYGSVKRVASAVGEGSVAIQILHELLPSASTRPKSG
jgi:thioredoxin reductase (NADPH)